jgi:hypothetical protein
LTIAAAVSLASATLAKEDCPVGQVYFRSKHACVGGCVKTQMRYRRMVGQLAVFDFRISTDVLRSMSF